MDGANAIKEKIMRQLKLSNNCNHDTLINFGFKKYGTSYKMFVPLYQKNTEALIECEILVSLEEKYIGYDILDTCNKTLYMAYYDKDSRCHLKNVVLKNIKEEVRKLFVRLEGAKILCADHPKECLDGDTAYADE